MSDRSSQPIRHALMLLVSFALVYMSVLMVERAPPPTAFDSPLGLMGLLGGSMGGLGCWSYGVALFSDMKDVIRHV